MSTQQQRPQHNEEALEKLLEHLKDSRGFDFTGYKRATLERRLRKRMGEVEVPDYESYVDYLEANPREFSELFNTILINVTSFFRDAEAWDYLREEIVAELIEAVPAEEQIRIWSAGCASGEEAYTAAIVLLEVLGEAEFKRRVKIYATDLDEEALAEARAAQYERKALENVPPELVERYFVENGRGFAFRPDLRRSVIFGRNELLQDAPISRIDLLICRNVLMYFTVEAQSRILSQLNFALRDRGFLFLGKSEMLVRHSEYFQPVDVRRRVFRRIPRRNLGEGIGRVVDDPALGEESTTQRHADLREAAASIGPVARLVVDSSRFLVDVNDRAAELFQTGPADLGRPLQDLELSYRPLELRAPLDRAFEHGQAVSAGRVEWGEVGSERIFDVEVTPIATLGKPIGAAITFADVTEFARLAAEHDKSKHELETAYEELQSTVEELETTNEELQSANEELQTMNEELSSTNDELEAMNEEQRQHTQELDRLNLFLEGILGNLGVGVAVVDREREVQLWNANSEDLWGLRADEVEGEDLLSLDIGLPVAELSGPLEQAFSSAGTSTDVVLEAVNRRGRSFSCEVRVMPLFSASKGLYGGIVLTRDVGESGDG